ncbi:TauD/TfdA family dioxygenase [Streptomyces sp. NPDC005271]|uniref:TauD/TfdA family dioxygenase n=1 Tax=unclassified Streptomyces TaxID=2593676 RepID=UPI0033BCB19B
MPEPRPESLRRLDAAPEPGTDAATWVTEQREEIRALVARHGAVLVRGLHLDGPGHAVSVVRRIIGEGMAEREGFAPRDEYGPGLYSSSHWPADQPMCMHHELSYAAETPRLMVFACVTPPSGGGVTAVADARAVLRDLPAGLVERFERHGWLLTRHYNPFVGIGWEDAFGVKDPAEVERYCADHGIEARWDADGGLRTRQIRPAVISDPESGERCWFNQIAFLNEWTMAPEVREFLTAEFGPDGLPFNTFYGDGSPLDRATVDLVNEVYEKHTVREPWQRGDLMVVDNVRMAHSREPYRGAREIVVGLGEPFRL